MASRLFLELRERHGLCYSIGSFVSPYDDTGALQISASCAPGNARELVRRTMAECLRLRDEGVSDEELERAKLQARTTLVFGQESASSRMFSMAHQAIHWGELRSLDQCTAEIQAVGDADLRRVAAEILRPETLGLAALGGTTQSEIRPQDLVA
jgi:predicted Zn-dependent peptidase